MPREIDIIDPTGQPGTMPEENLAKALQQGFRLPTAQDRKDAATRAEADTLGGALKTFVGQAADEFMAGAPEASLSVAAKSGVESAEALERRNAIYKEANPLANTLGGLAGFAGSFFNPLIAGPAGAAARLGVKGAKALSLGKTLTRAAEGAGEGVAYAAVTAAAPQLVEAIVGDPKRAAEQYALQVGLGGILGGAISTALGGVSSGYESAKKALSGGKVSDTAARVAVNTAGLTPTQLTNLEKFHGVSAEDVGRYLLSSGIVSAGDDKVASAAKLSTRAEEVGARIKQLLAETDARVPGQADSLNILDRALGAVDEKAKGAYTPAEAEAMERAIVDTFEGKLSANPSLTELQKFKKDLDRRIKKSFEKTANPPAKEALIELRRSIVQEIEGTFSKAANSQKEGEAATKALWDYLGLKSEFEMIDPLQKGFAKQKARQLSPGGSFLEKAVMGSIGVGAGYGAITNPESIPEILLGAVALNVARRRGSSTLAAFLDKISSSKLAVPDLDKIRPRFAVAGSTQNMMKEFSEAASLVGSYASAPMDNQDKAPRTGYAPLDTALGIQANQVMDFLSQKLPKNPTPDPMNPNAPYKPSDMAVSKFLRYYDAAFNPKNAVESLSQEGLQALRVLYPSIYNDLLQGISERYAGKKNSRKTNDQLSKFFQTPGQGSLPLLQQMYQSQDQSNASSGSNELSLGQTSKSQSQKIESR